MENPGKSNKDSLSFMMPFIDKVIFLFSIIDVRIFFARKQSSKELKFEANRTSSILQVQGSQRVAQLCWY